jgi:ribosomal protein S18 acetylase RimI-like enzyme
MPSAAKLVLRGAQPHERSAIVEMLAAAFADSDVGRWLGGSAADRAAHFGTAVDGAFAGGIVRVADEQGTIVGAALWFPYPGVAPSPLAPAVLTPSAFSSPPPSSPPPSSPPFVEPAVGAERLALLERLLAERHPTSAAHHHLAYLGVRPDRQGQGIGSYLLIGHHAYLHVADLPAYLEANDPRNRQLYLRHGYSDIGPPIVLPTGIPIWPMWRPPTPAGSVPASSAPRVAFLSYQ